MGALSSTCYSLDLDEFMAGDVGAWHSRAARLQSMPSPPCSLQESQVSAGRALTLHLC
jgi:hypothetical protein